MRNLRVCILAGLTGALAATGFYGCKSLPLAEFQAPSGVGLAGKKTFTVGFPSGGTQYISTGPGGTASTAVVQAIGAELQQRGYVLQAAGPADFAVSPGWSYQQGSNPNFIPTQPNQQMVTPYTVMYITLSIVARDGATNHILWRGSSPFPVVDSSFSPGMAQTMARQALDDFPAATAAGNTTGH